MSEIHPNDTLAALEWAVARAREAGETDSLARLNVLPALLEARDAALRVVR